MSKNQEAEVELESFRQQWREEVFNRTKRKDEGSPEVARPQPGPSASSRPRQAGVAPAPPARTWGHGIRHDQIEEFEPRTFHDLDDKEDDLKLGEKDKTSDPAVSEPRSALDHYEKAVERETAGSLGDSLDSGVHEAYKKKHFSPSSSYSSKPANQTPSNASLTTPDTTHASLHDNETATSSSLNDLINTFASLSIPPAPAETDLSSPRPCPIASIPEEILSDVFLQLAIDDVASYARLTQVCKRFAYLVTTEDKIWKHVALGPEFGIASMHYRYACDVYGKPLSQCAHYVQSAAPAELARIGTHNSFPVEDGPRHAVRYTPSTPSPSFPLIPNLTPIPYQTYRSQYRHRPRLRYNGCYISVVNYQRPGAASSESQYTWTASPIHIVTYYRYLRFFRDGTVISLLTSAEPVDVVHHMTKENIRDRERLAASTLPSAIMKDALGGRWRLTGKASTLPVEMNGEGALENEEDEAVVGNDERATTRAPIADTPGIYEKEPRDSTNTGLQEEKEGTLHIETEGVVPKYMWKMTFGIASAGGGKEGLTTRNNKLAWKGFWSYNRVTDDWGEFGMRHYRPFYWSRVKSYGIR
ncbi:MAG: hypothetical protein M1831_006549 [Alyxoria varia]|nr:MAG: hypothetical protein M1831_006549 [Alyxoria varia]